MKPSPPPRIPANELRPSRRWYVAAGAIAVVLILMAAVIGVLRFNSATQAVDTGHPFANGRTVTLRLDPGSEKSIWIRDEEFGPIASAKCSVTGPGDPRLTGPGVDVFLTRHETWNPLYTIDVSRAGDFEVTCSSHAESKYAIGDAGGFFALAGWLALAVALAVLGIVLCAAIVLVTAVRRTRHRKRKRLLAERHPAHVDPQRMPSAENDSRLA